MIFLDQKYFVKKKGLRSKICPDCGGFFTKTEDGYLCNLCGFELDKNGSSKSYFYGVITIENK
jgi:predicted amidophosphoribosyltransferase